MTKGYIYKRRLLKLADYLYQLKRKQFDYSYWLDNTDPECGTVACALGHACFMPEFRRLGLHIDGGIPAIRGTVWSAFTAAERIFGLSLEEYRFLFVPDMALYNERFGWEQPHSSATPKQVAKHIRRFVKWKYDSKE